MRYYKLDMNSKLFSKLPEELISRIVLDAIILLKNETWRDIHDELKLILVTPKTEFGCIFLTYTNIEEFINIDYSYAERLPALV